jgi:hypothetical protein
MQSFYLLAFICFISKVVSECPNACSSHGSCGQYDMCTCYRNWMSNDCSQRVCQFNNAHVDIPLGDLDMSSGKLSDTTVTVIKNSALYPYGTTEQFPDMGVLSNTAHAYTECSSKGICDRQTGSCDCFTGYSGSACQRASCPSNAAGICSGHGVCKSIKNIAFDDYNNTYDLWDKHASMGCVCDGGFSGPDCSEKKCKWGVDPLYKNDGRNPSVSNYTFEFWTQTAGSEIEGNYSIVFTDIFGETWKTEALDISSSCDAIQKSLYDLPNNVINSGVWCYRSAFTLNNGGTSQGQEADINAASYTHGSKAQNPIANAKRFVFEKYTLVFKDNAGNVPQPSIEIYLDGNRPTLYSSPSNDMKVAVYKNGFAGEDIDYIPDRCNGVTVTIDDTKAIAKVGTEDFVYIVPTTDAMTKLLKICLGDSNGDNSDNVEVYNWDYGTVSHPHVIKLLDLTQWSNNNYDTSSSATFQTASSTDPEDYVEPKNRICDDIAPDDARYGPGLCSNKNPAAFYVMMYFNSDPAVMKFVAFHHAGVDYSITTKFAVYTTTNTFQLTNPNSIVVSSFVQTRSNRDFTNFVHLTNGSFVGDTDNQGVTTKPDFTGEVSCEHNPGSYNANGDLVFDNGAYNCLDKEDKIMIVKMPVEDKALGVHNHAVPGAAGTNLECNPAYLNLYTIKKMWRSELTLEDYLDEEANKNSEMMRNRMLLDSGINADYYHGGDKFKTSITDATFTDTNGCGAYIYKLILNTTTYAKGGYEVASECSGRGICNSDNGLCGCFAGYTNDNCDTQSSLVM